MTKHIRGAAALLPALLLAAPACHRQKVRTVETVEEAAAPGIQRAHGIRGAGN